MIYISEIAHNNNDEKRKASSANGFDYYLTSDGRCFRLPSDLPSKEVADELKSAIKGEFSKAKLMKLYIVGDKAYCWFGKKKKCLASEVIRMFTTLGTIKPNHILYIDGDITNCGISNLAVTVGKANLNGKVTTIKTKSGQEVMFRSCSSAAKTFGYSKSYLSKMVSQPSMQSRSSVIDTVTTEGKDA